MKPSLELANVITRAIGIFCVWKSFASIYEILCFFLVFGNLTQIDDNDSYVFWKYEVSMFIFPLISFLFYFVIGLLILFKGDVMNRFLCGKGFKLFPNTTLEEQTDGANQ